jgi:hypothetical protein
VRVQHFRIRAPLGVSDSCISVYTAPPAWAARGDAAAGREGMVGEEEEEENRVDREWRELLENSKLLSASKSGLDVTYITGLVRTYVT